MQNKTINPSVKDKINKSPGKEEKQKGWKVQLKESLKGKNFSEGRAALKPDSAVKVAKKGFQGALGSLPHKEKIEQCLGVDMSGVKAYSGPDAQKACEELNAEAYTYGDQVAFKNANPSLNTAAHEAVHVVQQSAGAGMEKEVSKPSDISEKEADKAAGLAANGKSSSGAFEDTVKSGAKQAVQRYTEIGVLDQKKDYWDA